MSLAQVLAVLDAEAAGADDAGLSTLSPDQVAAASGVPPRTVRLIRAGLANSGLVSRTSSTSPLTQLQLPRGTTGSGIRTPERTDR